MNLDRFSGPGSTPVRRRFWDKVQSAVMASRKVAGRNVTVDEHSGAGSVINAPDRRRTPSTAACPPENPCTVDVEIILPTIGTGSLTGKPVSGDGSEDPDHWIAEPWETITDCSDQCSTCDEPFATVCEAYMRWRFADGTTRAIITLDRVVGDTVLTDGWYISVFQITDGITCVWDGNVACYYLGADDSIFATDLSLSFPITSTDPDCADGTVNLVFHPC